MAMTARVLETSEHSDILVQVRTDRHEVLDAMSARSLLDRIQSSLADKIAAQLFETVSPAMIEALRGICESGEPEHE